MNTITQNPQTDIQANDTPANDIADLMSERIDNLAALVTVTAEQMDDRLRAEQLLDEDSGRTNDLLSLVFGGRTPSIENYLATQSELQAA